METNDILIEKKNVLNENVISTKSCWGMKLHAMNCPLILCLGALNTTWVKQPSSFVFIPDILHPVIKSHCIVFI